jgi:hypothetical protein
MSGIDEMKREIERLNKEIGYEEAKKGFDSELCTCIGKMRHDSWANLIMLNNNTWFIADRIKRYAEIGNSTFAEFYLDDSWDYDWLKNRIPGTCLNITMLRSGMSVNVESIVSIQQFDS